MKYFAISPACLLACAILLAGPAAANDFEDEIRALEGNTADSEQAADVDFADEINQLDQVPVNSNRAGSWGSDIQRWNEGKAIIADRKRAEQIGELTRKCETQWRNADATACRESRSSQGMLPTLTVSCYISCAENWRKRCPRSRYKSARSFDRCIEAIEASDRRRAERQAARQKEADERRAKIRRQNCLKQRQFCLAAEKELKAGKLPTKKYPAWTAEDEAKFAEADNFLDAELESALQEARSLADPEDAEASARKQARLEREAALKQKANANRNKREQWCLMQFGQDQYPCACNEFLPEGIPTCAK